MNEYENSHPRPAGARIIDMFFSPAEISDERLRTYKSVVVVDVLRAATSISMALSNGAKAVMPVLSISAATALATQLARNDVLLCGEREGKPIEGFHLGNSPSDYSRERVRGKTLIFATTNGTPALVKATGVPTVVLCGFVNLPSSVELLFENDPFPLAILCAGKMNRFSVEDAVCGGQMIERITSRIDTEPILNDAARISQLLVKEYGEDILGLLHNSDHGKYLISIGMEEDLPHCAAPGVLPVVPMLKDGKIVKWESRQ